MSNSSLAQTQLSREPSVHSIIAPAPASTTTSSGFTAFLFRSNSKGHGVTLPATMTTLNLAGKNATPAIGSLRGICEAQNTAKAKARLASASALNYPIDAHGNSALHLATLNGDLALVALLLRRGADPTVQNAAGLLPLDVARALANEAPDTGYPSQLPDLLAQFSGVGPGPFPARAPIQLASPDIVVASTSPNALAALGQTWHILPHLQSSPFRAGGGDTITPLMQAVSAGHVDTAAKIIAYSGNNLTKDLLGLSVVDWSAIGGWPTTLDLLADPAATSPLAQETRAAEYAAFSGHSEMLQRLAGYGVRNLAKSLMLAAWMRHARAVKVLLDLGAEIPQPFSAWLAVGRSIRANWELEYVLLDRDVNSADPALSQASSPVLVSDDIEIDRLLTIATPEEILVAGKALVKSVPTKTAHKAGSDLRAELDTQEAAAREVFVPISGVPRFRRTQHPPDAPIDQALNVQDDDRDIRKATSFVDSLAAEELAHAHRALEHIAPFGTELDAIVCVMAGQVLELIKRASACESSKFTATAVSIASHVQLLSGRIQRVPIHMWPLSLHNVAQAAVNGLTNVTIPALMKATRLASGIWPPPLAISNMIATAITVLEQAHQMAQKANVLGVWSYGKILRHHALVPMSSSPQSAAATGIGAEGLSFESYRRANQVHQIDQISQQSPLTPLPSNRSRSGSSLTNTSTPTAGTAPVLLPLPASSSSLGTQTAVTTSALATASEPELHPQDAVFFLQEVDPKVKHFAETVRQLRTSVSADEKARFRDQSHALHGALDAIVDLISSHALLVPSAATADISVVPIPAAGAGQPSGGTQELQVPFTTAMASAISDARAAAELIVSRSRIAAGVWPPPQAAKELLVALPPVVAATKRLVSTARRSIWAVRAHLDIDIARVEDQRRIWMHGEQVRTMFTLWENASARPAFTAVPGNSLVDKEMLEDPSDGLVMDEHSNLRGGRLVRMIEALTWGLSNDEAFLKAFLMTHHSFTTSEDLMAVLLKRYEVSPPLGIKDEATFQSWVESKLMPVKSQVLQVLSFWVTYQFADFVANDKALLVKLNEFLNVKALPDFPVKAAHIQDLLSARLASFDHPDSPINLKLAPKPILTKSVSKLTGPDKELQLLSVDETELARQWALVESSLFRQIGPKELINQIWGRTHESSKTKAPTISKMIEITSHMTYLVVAMILRAPNEKQRHAVVKYWVRVGQACAKLNNFNALTAIFGGFTSLPIKRLDRLWKTFKSAHPKSNELLGQLSELVSASGQYAAYRRALKACQPPCLPYLGVYITDLTLIEEGNQDYLPQNGSLINFEKRRKVATVIDEILARQQQCIYHLIAVPALQDFLTSSHERLSEVEAFKLSVAVEPLPEEDDEDDD